MYGHNGSGKSTVAELLLALAEGACPTGIVWGDETSSDHIVRAGGVCPSESLAVFTHKWVDANLSAFLDGDSAPAIVTLGKEAIDAKEEEARLAGEIVTLREEASKAAGQQADAEAEVDTLARDVQDRIVSELKPLDNFFTKNRFSLPTVKEKFRGFKGEVPDSMAHAEALRGLGQGALPRLPEVALAPNGVARNLAGLSELLAETPTRIAIRALESNSVAQTWVERGITLHEKLDHCLFCAGLIDDSRRDELARHFDESWFRIRSKAKAMCDAIENEKKALAVWRADLPAPERLAGELRSVYEEALKRVEADVDQRISALEAIEKALDLKVADPGATPGVPEWSVLSTTPPATVLVQVVKKHNGQVERHEQVTAERKQTVLNHLVGSQSETFRELQQKAENLAETSKKAKSAEDKARRRLDQARQKQFTTGEMAETLTRDLSHVYGKGYLSVEVASGGKSYICHRGDKPATNLSDGERTTLSLLYFLRKLEDEQTPNGKRSQQIVVIDDPSSSLDREALFATHQWLFDTLKDFGQYIILTHDFSLLRLFIKSQHNSWGKSLKRIEEGRTAEIRFPKVSFLELYATTVDGERRSRVGKLPRVLLDNTSEYVYLFSMVMTGLVDSEDDDHLYLLPNAARRVLEVFASYKVPHRTDFIQQLDVLVKAQQGEPYRDVYDFCNRFSHGEGSESIDVLDARAVHVQIRRCMEFMCAVDGEHFERMCKATGIDASTLISREISH